MVPLRCVRLFGASLLCLSASAHVAVNPTPPHLEAEADRIVSNAVLPNGIHRLMWASGVAYEGEVVGGARHGFGRLIRPSRSLFEGQWLNDRPHGSLRVFYRGGEGGGILHYEGQWSEGQYHGDGVLTHESGRRFEGRFDRGQIGANGTWFYPSGGRYRGKLRSGLPHGRGTYRQLNAAAAGGLAFYRGKWIDGVQSDTDAISSWVDGTRHRGGWRAGNPDGSGRFWSPPAVSGGWKTLVVYEGDFRGGVRQGNGTMWHTVMPVHRKLTDDVLWGDLSTAPGARISYTGSFATGEQHGPGKEWYANQEHYEGEFAHGQRHGHGVCYNVRGGVRWEGQWRKGAAAADPDLRCGTTQQPTSSSDAGQLPPRRRQLVSDSDGVVVAAVMALVTAAAWWSASNRSPKRRGRTQSAGCRPIDAVRSAFRMMRDRLCSALPTPAAAAAERAPPPPAKPEKPTEKPAVEKRRRRVEAKCGPQVVPGTPPEQPPKRPVRGSKVAPAAKEAREREADAAASAAVAAADSPASEPLPDRPKKRWQVRAEKAPSKRPHQKRRATCQAPAARRSIPRTESVGSWSADAGAASGISSGSAPTSSAAASGESPKSEKLSVERQSETVSDGISDVCRSPEDGDGDDCGSDMDDTLPMLEDDELLDGADHEGDGAAPDGGGGHDDDGQSVGLPDTSAQLDALLRSLGLDSDSQRADASPLPTAPLPNWPSARGGVQVDGCANRATSDGGGHRVGSDGVVVGTPIRTDAGPALWRSLPRLGLPCYVPPAGSELALKPAPFVAYVPQHQLPEDLVHSAPASGTAFAGDGMRAPAAVVGTPISQPPGFTGPPCVPRSAASVIGLNHNAAPFRPSGQ
eukprot:TRINITY_DN6779_c0_g1_i1.p1 TRINITY_DN6779_c0_g1~~TRINITY_DN6779_c0_g1_i1.p1  ORF type:complete len:857 (+),score=148.94 TRINITY_DN6779_c0_g1_i1:51-2621(+)